MSEKDKINDQFYREVLYYEDHYLNFFKALKPAVQKKFNWTLLLIAKVERVPEKYLKHITGSKGLFEVRVENASDIYRVFCFFEESKLIILLNGFQKKSMKTPRNQIKRAEQLKEQYCYEKQHKKDD